MAPPGTTWDLKPVPYLWQQVPTEATCTDSCYWWAVKFLCIATLDGSFVQLWLLGFIRLYSVSFKFFQWTYYNKVSESSQEGIQVPMSEEDATKTYSISCPGPQAFVLGLTTEWLPGVPSSHSQITGLLSLHILWANSCNKSPLISIDLSIYLSIYVRPFDSISLENPNTSSFYPKTWQNERSLQQWYSLQYQLTPLWSRLFFLLFLLSLYNTT